MSQTNTLVGIDTGGTFTDFVAVNTDGEIRTAKVLSTPADPSQAIITGLKRLGVYDLPLRIVHGTTVGTNAVLENKGDPVVFITNEGFADLLTLARQNRTDTYALSPPPVQPPVPESMLMEAPVRMAADGSILQDFDAQTLSELATNINTRASQANAAVAICLLFSWRNAEHEQQLKNKLADVGDLFVTTSAEVLPLVGEYERAVATWLNAAIGPKLGRYFARLQQQLPEASLAIMQSAGQTVAIEQAATQAIRLLLSGPAGGLAAIAALGQMTNMQHLLSFDMGGTSTDVALFDEQISLTSKGKIGRWPVSVPMIDMHTIGAGGGSIAWLDTGGGLQIGPQSAGAAPGPACYGNGGQAPTVTDANLVLGRIPSAAKLGGDMTLDIDAAKAALRPIATQLGQSIEELASGIIRIANEHMVRALRVMSAERGHNNADLTLTSFGGAGGLHVCALAELLNIKKALVPIHGGVLSALGMLLATPGRELTQAILQRADTINVGDILSGFAQLEESASQQLQSEGHSHHKIQFIRQLDCRYQGQSAWFSMPWPATAETALKQVTADFSTKHEQVNGHQLTQPIEIVNLRLTAKAEPWLDRLAEHNKTSEHAITQPDGTQLVYAITEPVKVIARESIDEKKQTGPLIVQEALATLWVAPSWSIQADRYGNLLLSRL